MSEFNKEEALKRFETRKNNPPEKINNELLPAGSSMYFYCDYCDNISEILPEYYTVRPKHTCDACQQLIDNGVDLS